MAARVYLVEDDESIRELVLYALASSGYEARGSTGSWRNPCGTRRSGRK